VTDSTGSVLPLRSTERYSIVRSPAPEMVMTGFGLPREQVLAEIAAFEALRALGDARPNDVIAHVTGRPPKPFRQYAEQAAARGAWVASA
jgi:hypothetical protein